MRFFSAFAIFFLIFLLPGSVLSGADVLQVQEKLKSQDFYFGEPTGVLDEETSTALRRYQIRNDLAVTGELDQATAKSLGVSASVPVTAPSPTGNGASEFPENRVVGVSQSQPNPSTPAPAAPKNSASDRRQQQVAEFLAPSSYARVEPASQLEVVRWTQTRLKKMGYYQSGIDGVPGDGTRRAVAAYQADYGLRPTGILDDVTLDFLENRVVSGAVSSTIESNTRNGGEMPAIRGQQVFRGLRIR